MASPFTFTAFFSLFNLACFANFSQLPSFERIYQFGDSLADTGNLIRLPSGNTSNAGHLPYGETYFGKPTGRFSDGRLIVDFIADALKLPFLDAYLNKNGSFAHGVNFAVAGATASDEEFFRRRNLSIADFRPPLSKQLEWFESHLKTHAAESRSFEKTLFIFGEFGGNDYFPFFREGKSPREIKPYVPYVVAAIIRGIKRIVELGAKRIVVPGPFTFGCLPAQLAAAASNATDPTAYDKLGCLKDFNGLSAYHNRYLRRAISSLSRELSGKGVVIVYADYEGAVFQILRNPSFYGFDKKRLLQPCCGGGGKNQSDKRPKPCGAAGAKVCRNPSRAVHWDGVHLTDAAYHRIAHILIGEVFSPLSLTN